MLQVSVTAEGEGYVVDQTVSEENGQRKVHLVLEPPVKENSDSGEDNNTAEEETEGENAGEGSGSSP
ncbi:hypothetical protein D3C73_1533560 [compost metagenome]